MRTQMQFFLILGFALSFWAAPPAAALLAADDKPADEKQADEKQADEKQADEKQADEKQSEQAEEKQADEKKSENKDAKETEFTPIEPAMVDLGRPVDFERDIYPILDNNCIACHNLAISESKLNLEEIEGILKGGSRGPGIVPKDLDKSLIYRVSARAADPVMPPLPNKVEAAALTPKELGLLRQWILEGASAGAGSASADLEWTPFPSNLQQVFSVALSPWGRLAAAGRANQIAVYDLIAGEELAQLTDPELAGLQFDGKPMYPRGAAHRDYVHALAFNHDGTLLASGGYRMIKLWQRPQNVQMLKVSPDQPVTALAADPQGRLLALAGADNQIRLWNLADGKPAGTLSGHSAPVTGLMFSADGTQLASGSADKTLRVWNAADGAQIAQIDTPAEIKAVAFNPEATQIASGHADNLIRIWETPAPADKEDKEKKADDKDAENKDEGDKKDGENKPAEPVRELSGHGGPVTSLALLLPGGTQLVSGSEDGTLRIWEWNDGKQVRSMNHGGPVTSVAVSPDGQQVASGSANNTAKVWETGSGKQLAEMKGDRAVQRHVALRTEEVEVAKQRDGLAKAAVDAADKDHKERGESAKKAKEAKDEAEKAVAEAEKKAQEAAEAVEAAKKAAEEKDDDEDLKKKLAEAEAEAKKQQDELKKAQDAQASAGRTLESAQKAEKTAEETLQQAKSRKEAAEAEQKQAEAALAEAKKAEGEAGHPVRAVAFSPDGKKLATGGEDGAVRLWNADDGKPLDVFSGHAGPVAAVAFGPGRSLISGSADKTAVVWDSNPPWELIARLGAQPDAPLDVSESPFVSRVLCLDFSPDGKLLAAGGGDPSRSGELMIWDVEQKTLVREIEDAHSDTVFGLEFSRDGKYLASGAADKFVKVHEVESGRFVRSFEGHTHHVLDVSWKADGATIASAGADNAIKVWNVETGEQRRTISNYAKQVTSIQFVGIGENVVSSGGDKTVRLHRTGNGQNFRNFGGSPDFVYAAAATRDETVVISGGEDGVLRVWNGANGQTIINFDPPPPPADPEAEAQASTRE